MTVIGIAVAGAFGALARYGLEGAVSGRWPGEMVTEGLVTLERVEVIAYRAPG